MAGVAHLVREHFDHLLSELTTESRRVEQQKNGIVAYDTVERLRELQASPSLESVFAQLAVPEDTSAIAERLIAVMKVA